MLETCAFTPECAVAAGTAAETESAGAQETNPATTRSGQMPGVSGLDSNVGMRNLFKSERRGDRYRSCPY